VIGPILLKLNDAATVWVPIAKVAPQGLATDVAKLSLSREALGGAQSREDPRPYRVWHKADDAGGPPGKYLVDDAGRAVWFVDPGINGTFAPRPDGSTVHKSDAPTATRMPYIIQASLAR